MRITTNPIGVSEENDDDEINSNSQYPAQKEKIILRIKNFWLFCKFTTFNLVDFLN